MVKFGSSLRILMLTATTLAFVVPAQAQDSNRDIAQRLRQLEIDVQTMGRAVYKGDMPPPDLKAISNNSSSALAAQTDARLAQMESELQRLTGLIEESRHQLTQMQANIERATSDTEMRLNALEEKLRTQAIQPASPAPSPVENTSTGLSPAETGAMPPMPNATGTGGQQLGNLVQTPEGKLESTQNSNDPIVVYERAFALLRAGSYDEADKAFNDFLKRFPDNNLKENARYWLGETYYARKQYDQAARSFAEGYQGNPTGPKAADNLLKLGMSLAASGSKSDACVAYGQLVAKYANEARPVATRAEQEMKTLGCK